MHNQLSYLGILLCAITAVQAGELNIPEVWDGAVLESTLVPLADRAATPRQIPPEYYYGIPVRPIYKSYPVYRPDREPAGYLEWLKRQDPQIAFDTAKLKTAQDWISAGEIVFDAPISYGHIFRVPSSDLYLHDARWYRETGAPLAKDGSLPFYRYVIREKGRIEIGVNSCGMCHTRVMPDGSIIKGAQGNFPFDRAFAWDLRNRPKLLGPLTSLMARRISHLLYSAPWIEPDAYPEIDSLGWAEIAARHDAVPAGVVSRTGASPHAPAKVPDLIGIRERHYLDATGLVRHRGIGDLMRYASMNQDIDVLNRYKNFVPLEALPLFLGKVPEDPGKLSGGRYSDQQLYALALFIYSLQPPANPNPANALAAAGKKVFEREGCAECHAPPLYTNNMRTPVLGYRPPADDPDVINICVGTDPALALKTRRGTGYYKVPSLKGVWYRGQFEHSGSVAALEDWFNPDRLKDGYVPTGFVGFGRTTRAIKGHQFGLKLTADDKAALIAFLKTL